MDNEFTCSLVCPLQVVGWQLPCRHCFSALIIGLPSSVNSPSTIAEDDFIEETQAVGKVLVEVTGAGVEVRLEDAKTLGNDWEELFVNMNDGSNEGI